MTYVDCAIARGKADFRAGKPESANHYRNFRDDQCGPQMRHWWRIGWRVERKSALQPAAK